MENRRRMRCYVIRGIISEMFGMVLYSDHNTFLEFTCSERHSVDPLVAQPYFNEADINIEKWKCYNSV
jgi:hypothetical protein